MLRRALAALLIAAPGVARGGGLALGGSVVADDGASAVVVNPAALARRDVTRAQLGLVVRDDHERFDPDGAGPVIEERGPSTIFPVLGVQWAAGSLVVGASLIEDAAWSRRFAAPTPGQPADDVARLYPHRYASLAAAHHRRTIGAGVSWRASEWLAIGASVSLSRVTLDETRRIWAGFDGRTPTEVPGSADRDLEVAIAGTDEAVPGGVLGVLIAPIEVPIEVGASLAYADRAGLSGAVAITDSFLGVGPDFAASSGHATASLASPLIARLGARWLAERWIAELGGELSVYPGGDAPTWSISGVTIIDDLSGVTAPLDSLRSQVAHRTHGGARASADVEVIPGFLWLTAAYAFSTSSTPRAHLTPAAGDLAAHTAALGAELSTDGITVTLGYARQLTASTPVTATDLTIANPFTGTDATGLGTHDQSRDTVAITVEMEL